jgi:hypothetical protein
VASYACTKDEEDDDGDDEDDDESERGEQNAGTIILELKKADELRATLEGLSYRKHRIELERSRLLSPLSDDVGARRGVRDDGWRILQALPLKHLPAVAVARPIIQAPAESPEEPTHSLEVDRAGDALSRRFFRLRTIFREEGSGDLGKCLQLFTMKMDW